MNSFQARSTLKVGAKSYDIWRLDALKQHGDVARLPFSLKILLENLLRTEDGAAVTKEDVLALLKWNPKAEPGKEIAFTPARVLMQDFTGVPAIVDLAAMRQAIRQMGGDPSKVNPLVPAELVIDHSVQVDAYGSPDAVFRNAELEAQRNSERYVFLRWGQTAFRNFKVVPPDTGIVHQVNLEYLARVIFVNEPDAAGGKLSAYPDTLVGTDSHTTMINGLGVLGFGVGGIEAEAALLGQPVSMLIPHVVGFKLRGKLAEGATATDLVLTATQMLRKKGVVGKFVEFCGDGIAELSLADRATLANMAPEYGATIGLFPIDDETLRYMKLTGRSAEQIALVEAYCKEQGLWWKPGLPEPQFSDTLELDLATVEPSLAGPKRPQDRVPLKQSKAAFAQALAQMEQERAARLAAKGKSAVGLPKSAKLKLDGPSGKQEVELAHGSVVIAAITSCTNTSNPSVLMAAGLLAKKARAKGLASKPWVKTSLAPGSQVVTNYLKKAGLLADLEALNFHVVGYGCTTCIGNSGPLKPEIHETAKKNDLAVAAVLSGNRNFEGRVHPLVKMNYLASPPLVVAYALAGRADVDLATEPLGTGKDGKPVFLKDVWPTQKEVNDAVAACVDAKMYQSTYANVFAGDERWRSLPTPQGQLFSWQADSTYVKLPPYFADMPAKPAAIGDLKNARVLAVLGDSVTTDHISPAGDIPADSPAGKYLIAHGVAKEDFNSYGARRGNHELMMRGTFANVRLKNLLAPGTEGGVTLHLPDGALMSIFDAAMQYQKDGVPLVILAGKEYGSGSSRDWAAKGPRLLGVRVVIAESYERIHRSNLIGMGVLPLQFCQGQSAQSLGLTGRETFDVAGLGDGAAKRVKVTARAENGTATPFEAVVRIDTPKEVEYYRHGGILHYVLRRMRS